MARPITRPAQVPKRRGTVELAVDNGAVQLLRADGRYLLRQGDVAVDVTDVLVTENYPMGRIVLAVRLSEGVHATAVRTEPSDSPAPQPELGAQEEAAEQLAAAGVGEP